MVGYFREECVPLQMSVGGATACVVKGQGSSFSRSHNDLAILRLKKNGYYFQNFTVFIIYLWVSNTPKVSAWNSKRSSTPLRCFWVWTAFKGLSMEVLGSGSFLGLKSRSHLGMKSLKDSHTGNLLPKISHMSIRRGVSPLLVESLHSAQAGLPQSTCLKGALRCQGETADKNKTEVQCLL